MGPWRPDSGSQLRVDRLTLTSLLGVELVGEFSKP